MNTITKPGIFADFPIDAYFRDPCPAPSFSQSIGKLLIDRSPLHAWSAHPRFHSEPPAKEDYVSAQAIGNAAHKLILGRGKDIVVIEADNFRTKEAQTTRDAVSAEGKVPILAKHHSRATWMVKIAKEQLQTFGLAEFTGDTEAVIAWEEDDIWFRSMIDKLSTSRTLVVDYKTTGMSCAPDRLPIMLTDAGWDVQAAMHARGLDALHPESAGRRSHLFVVQENEEPYALCVVEITEAVMTMGRKKLQYAIDIWRRCIEADQWPGYPAEIMRPDYPGWAEAQWLNREYAHDEAVKVAANARIPHDMLMGG